MPLGSRVTLGSRVSFLLCITQSVLHAREGVPKEVGFPYLHRRDRSPLPGAFNFHTASVKRHFHK